ncbi:helix-turn-helix transcriptional regulator [Granulicella tundricola]|uniref:Repressor protein, putative n=1 Tax=Granulicella tundricola (strain ATCC BAA-1859 / DSM 23138 / MP5ACTX9) TaxID=1198114 RepID=E8WZQ6_GRATM|nr:YafY family protein [Granulicella tundricola]ADW70030.1 repressor protein, putative [Granulicella tundricola MP5ACTX9]
MDDTVSRIFVLLETLQGRDRVTGTELAERLDVDLRTIQRYVVRLKSLHIPIDSSPGVGGAYRLRPGYRLPPLVLTNEEAFALSLGLRALRQIGLSAFAPATEGALAKLGRVLPHTLRESLRTVEDVIAGDPSPWSAPASFESLITAATAIRTGHRIHFAYESHNATTSTRQVEPYAVIHMDGRWYLIGHCLSRAGLRTFRLDRVSNLETGTPTFERPLNFDARRYLADHMPFIPAEYEIDVWLDMPLEEAQRNFALWRIALEADAGGTRLRCTRDRLEIFAAMILSTGRPIKIHRPAELRETFRQLATQALQAANDSFEAPTPA